MSALTVTVGRFGRDVTTPVVSSVDVQGRTVRLAGFSLASSLADAKVLRQQLTGLMDNPDEPVVPVASNDTSLNGWYRVVEARMSGDAEGGDYLSRVFPWQVTLERAAPGYVPLVEQTLVAALRTNGHSIAKSSVQALFAVPSGSMLGASLAVFPFSGDFAWADDGSRLLRYVDDNPSTTYVHSWLMHPDDTHGFFNGFYQGAAKVESKWSDASTYRTVVGRHMPGRPGADVWPGHDWRLSNGLLRVAPAQTTGAGGEGCDLTVSAWDSVAGAWDTSIRFTLSVSNDGSTWGDLNTTAISAATVLRNDAAAVSLRLTISSDSEPRFVDLTLRRGATFVECREAGILQWRRVKRSSTSAATALTGGIRATSNDAAGNRWVLAGAQATTNDLTNGSISSTSSGYAYDFMIGVELDGSSATGNGTAQNLVYQFMCAQAETLRVIGR